MSKKLYAERNILKLDNYIDHISAMTTEGLHAKSDIAAELAYRDSVNETLKQQNIALADAALVIKSAHPSADIHSIKNDFTINPEEKK